MKALNLKYDNLYYIGGVVRDEILGLDSFDVDLTYEGNAIEFCKSLEAKRIGKILQINDDFGTVRMLINGIETDIASTRDEIYERKGHLPTVSDIGCSLKKDVLRRDFTVNAMAKSVKTGEIIDYTGGLKDIKQKKLKILHDKSFIDDPTRIIRGLKFAVRFGFELDEGTRSLQEEYLKTVDYDMSYKRLKKELVETFNLNSQKAFEIFKKEKMYKLLTPEVLDFPEYNIEDLVKKYPVENVWVVYLGWIKDIVKLPLTKEEKKIVDDYNSLLNQDIKDDDYSVFKTFRDKSDESVLLYVIKTGMNKYLKYFDLKNIRLQINGEDLIKMGIEPCKEYSVCFDYVLGEKFKSPDLTREEELDLAKKFFM